MKFIRDKYVPLAQAHYTRFVNASQRTDLTVVSPYAVEYGSCRRDRRVLTLECLCLPLAVTRSAVRLSASAPSDPIRLPSYDPTCTPVRPSFGPRGRRSKTDRRRSSQHARQQGLSRRVEVHHLRPYGVNSSYSTRPNCNGLDFISHSAAWPGVPDAPK